MITQQKSPGGRIGAFWYFCSGGTLDVMKVPLASMKASDPRRQERQGQPPRVAQMQGRRERQVLKGRRAPMADRGSFYLSSSILSTSGRNRLHSRDALRRGSNG